ncbi:adenosine receptor A2a-like [Stylophora pistillata]|uniref:adenosine receptor A2a-like n=1 Tax=Stylophora pistillata TaxID=50429 RepID=UPI000C045E85|nr:adenosine receptor A2a-like [Stylophora pistillata]
MGVTRDLCEEVLIKFYAKAEYVDSVYITMNVINGLLTFSAIFGNAAIIFALQKASSIPTTTKILMQSLAVTDVCSGFFSHPLYIAVVTRIRQSHECKHIQGVLMAFFVISAVQVSVSLQVVTVIGIDRFLSITLHLRYNELVTPNRVLAVVASVWVLSLSIVFVGVSNEFLVGETVILVFGYVGMLLLCIVYSKVYFVARRHQVNIQSQAHVTAHHLSNTTNPVRNVTLAVKVLYVFVVFVFCTLPYLITLTVLLISDPNVVLQGTIQMSAVLVMLNSSLNPIVFGLKMKEIRQIMKSEFRKLFRCT